ncbi:MAG: SDR family oxidoreductase [Burkholderiales bacterium]|nr:SDR family oxidoreductase [Anaerolineae bacterium]
MLLENKNAIVYGAGGAVGGAVARAFAREGAKVFLAGRTLTKLDAVTKDITSAGGAAETAQVDALDEQAVENYVKTIADKAGSIDISFNAVGIEASLGKPIAEMSAEDFDKPLAQMIRTQFVTAKAAAQHMIPQGSGVILTITSPHGRLPAPNFGPVDAIQASIEGFCRQLAAELGPQGIRVICIRSAGSPDSPSMAEVGRMMAETSDMSKEEMQAKANEGLLLRRFPMLAEISNVAALMASDMASPMTATFANATCGAIID